MALSQRLIEPLLEPFNLRTRDQRHYANAFVIRAIRSSASSFVRIKGGKN
jgi:hypothetical protein